MEQFTFGGEQYEKRNLSKDDILLESGKFLVVKCETSRRGYHIIKGKLGYPSYDYIKRTLINEGKIRIEKHKYDHEKKDENGEFIRELDKFPFTLTELFNKEFIYQDNIVPISQIEFRDS